MDRRWPLSYRHDNITNTKFQRQEGKKGKVGRSRCTSRNWYALAGAFLLQGSLVSLPFPRLIFQQLEFVRVWGFFFPFPLFLVSIFPVSSPILLTPFSSLFTCYRQRQIEIRRICDHGVHTRQARCGTKHYAFLVRILSLR